MSATIETLEQRIAQLENHLTLLQQKVDKLAPEPPVPARFQDIPLFREAYLQQAGIDAVTEDVFRKMGIPDAPAMSFEEFSKLRDSMPLPPEEEWASREILRMREE